MLKSTISYVLLVATIAVTMTHVAHAADVGPLQLRSVSATDGFCSIRAPEEIATESDCKSKYARWDCTSVSGENILKLATAAVLSGRNVYVVTEGCFGSRPAVKGIELLMSQ